MSLPSIVTDINGCNEIIENNVNGKLIKLKSVYDKSILCNEFLKVINKIFL